jgi:uncharacterized damage-inducible protein DinB
MNPFAHFSLLARYNAWATRRLLEHVFNPGTRHRGQITAALTARRQPCPELDLVYLLQEESVQP